MSCVVYASQNKSTVLQLEVKEESSPGVLRLHAHIPRLLWLTDVVTGGGVPLALMLEVGFVLLHLHHEVVQVDELRADGQAAERRLVQDLVEAVVVLDELGQSALQHRQEGAS